MLIQLQGGHVPAEGLCIPELEHSLVVKQGCRDGRARTIVLLLMHDAPCNSIYEQHGDSDLICGRHCKQTPLD